jgi:hypothetical protein
MYELPGDDRRKIETCCNALIIKLRIDIANLVELP